MSRAASPLPVCHLTPLRSQTKSAPSHSTVAQGRTVCWLFQRRYCAHKVFLLSCFARDIVTAIRVGNGVTDLDINARLRTAINAARAVDMPKDKIEGGTLPLAQGTAATSHTLLPAAIRTGKGEGAQPQSFVFECTAPGTLGVICSLGLVHLHAFIYMPPVLLAQCLTYTRACSSGGILMVIDAEAEKRVNAVQDLKFVTALPALPALSALPALPCPSFLPCPPCPPCPLCPPACAVYLPARLACLPALPCLACLRCLPAYRALSLFLLQR